MVILCRVIVVSMQDCTSVNHQPPRDFPANFPHSPDIPRDEETLTSQRWIRQLTSTMSAMHCLMKMQRCIHGLLTDGHEYENPAAAACAQGTDGRLFDSGSCHMGIIYLTKSIQHTMPEATLEMWWGQASMWRVCPEEERLRIRSSQYQPSSLGKDPQ